jgi:transposase-like protein
MADAKAIQRRRYAPEVRVMAVAACIANAGNVKKTSRETGIPHGTLLHWYRGTRHPEVAEELPETKRTLVDQIDSLVQKLVDSVPDKIDEANLSATTVSIGILIDKAMLLRANSGAPTEPEQPIDLDLLTPEQVEQLYGWLSAAAQAKSGTSPDGRLHDMDVAELSDGVAPPDPVPTP